MSPADLVRRRLRLVLLIPVILAILFFVAGFIVASLADAKPTNPNCWAYPVVRRCN